MHIYGVLSSVKVRPPRHRLELGNAIRKRRQSLGLSQEQLSESVNCHRNFVGRIERGEQNPTVDTLVRIAGGLSCTVKDLLKETNL